MTGWISVGSLALYISFPSVSFFIVVITRSCQVSCRPKWPASFMRGKGGRERILENTERHSSENFSEICINCSKWSKIYLDMGHMAYILCYDTFWNTQDFWPNSTEFAQSFNIFPSNLSEAVPNGLSIILSGFSEHWCNALPNMTWSEKHVIIGGFFKKNSFKWFQGVPNNLNIPHWHNTIWKTYNVFSEFYEISKELIK